MFQKIKLPDLVFSEIAEGVIQSILINNKKIGLLKRDGKLLAFSATCPHAGALLTEGFVDARGHLVCPLHGYRFNPANGYNSSGEGYKLSCYEVVVEQEEVFVKMLG